MTHAFAIVDAHQHCWRLGANDCTWPTADLTPIYRDAELAELESLARPLGVVASVLVQSQPSDRDTDYLLDLAAANPFATAVVGWVDLASPAAPARIASLAARPKLRGLRPMLQGLPEDDWILRPELAPALEAMLDHQLVFDALVFPRHLPVIRTLAEAWPGLQLVIDHAAKPPIAGGGNAGFQQWYRDMARLAALPQVSCKLSGLLTEAGAGQGAEALTPWMDGLLELFGPDRLLWGSDWPVLGLAPNTALSGYADWLDLVRAWLNDLPVAEQAAVLGVNARKFYKF